MTRSGRALVILGGLAGLCILTALLLKTAGLEVRQIEVNESRLNDLKRLDVALNETVLKLRFGLLRNYDQPSKLVLEMRESLRGLERVAPDVPQVASAKAVFEATFARKAAITIDEFPPENSALRNSIQYFPVAAFRLTRDEGGIGLPPEIRRAIDELTHAILISLVSPSPEIEVETASQIARLADATRIEWHESVGQLLAHARMILDERAGVDSLVAELVALPTQEHLTDLGRAYGESYAVVNRRAGWYRLLLYALSVVLLVGVTLAMVRVSATVQLLNRANRETENIIRSLIDSLMILEPDGTIRSVNPATCFLLGADEQDLVGRPIADLVLPSDRETLADALASLRAGTVNGQAIHDQQLSYCGRDGEALPVSFSASAMVGTSGSADALVVLARDLRERTRLLEQEMLLVASEAAAVEAQVRATELFDAKEAADAANLAKGNFLATMSHEIRTPINVIIGMTDMALDGPLRDEARDYLATVRRATLSLLTLVNDILDCAKIESGKVTLEVVDVSLRSLLAETVELLRGQAQTKGLALTYTVGRGVPERVRADPGRLSQVLMNLVGNAIKFTQTGGIVVGFELLGRSTTDVRLRGTVRDSGIGIPIDRQGAVFESFTQADDSTTRIYGGTGLGLSICRQLVELMDGRIGIESALGQGSTFWFEIVLPVARPGRAAKRQSAVSA